MAAEQNGAMRVGICNGVGGLIALVIGGVLGLAHPMDTVLIMVGSLAGGFLGMRGLRQTPPGASGRHVGADERLMRS